MAFVGDCLKRIADGIKQVNNSQYFDEAAAAQAKAKAIYKVTKEPTFLQKFDSYIRNSYLSATTTPIINVLGNITKVITEPLVTFGTSLTSKDVKMVDALHELQGMAMGFMKAAPRFWDNLTDTLKQGGLGAVDVSESKISGMTSGKLSDIRLLNQIGTFPIALTKALDEGTKAVLDSMGVEVAKARLLRDDRVLKYAAKNKISPDELATEAGKFLQGDPSKLDLLGKFTDLGKYTKEIKLWSDYNTYNNPLGNSTMDRIAKAIEGARERTPVIGTLLVPFIKVPLNVAKEGASYVPGLGMLRAVTAKNDYNTAVTKVAEIESKLLDAKRKAGQALDDVTKEAAIARVEKLTDDLNKMKAYRDFTKELPARYRAQQMIGIGIALQTYSMANSGMITGHFNDPALRERMEAAGIPPMSVKVGGNWYSYEKIEPFATIMGMMADWSAHEKSMARQGKPLMDIETAKKVPQILADNFFNKTYTESLFKVSQAVAQPERYGANLAGILNPVVPSAVAQVATIQDPTKRDIKEGLMSPVNALQARIPGLREQLPAQIDILGQEKKQIKSTAEGILGKTPITPTSAEQTGAQRLISNPFLKIGAMTKDVYGMELEPKDLEMIKRDAGVAAMNVLNALGSDPGFNSLARPIQAQVVKKTFTMMRNANKAKMLGKLLQNPEQRAEFIKNRLAGKGLQEDTGE